MVLLLVVKKVAGDITLDADGGDKGSVIECFGIATGGQGSATAVWHLYSPLLIGDGTLATPFA